jgi:hypothetical protein
MGNSGTWPNFNAWLETAWGAGQEFWCNSPAFYGAANLVFGTNPPFTLDDFWAMNPKFFGQATPLSGCSITNGSKTLSVPSVAGLMPNQFIQAPGVLPKGTVITALGNGSITVSNAATVDGTNITVTTYTAPPVPVFVIGVYLNLAWASLQQIRWGSMWYPAMCLYIAHYLTLYAQTDESSMATAYQSVMHGEIPAGVVPGTVYTLSAQPVGGVLASLTINGVYQQPGVDYTLNGVTITMTSLTVLGDILYVTWPTLQAVSTPVAPNGAQIAAQGLAGGIQVSKSVGDVSVSYQALEALADWGALALTKYGQQLATWAKVVGSGPMVIW